MVPSLLYQVKWWIALIRNLESMIARLHDPHMSRSRWPLSVVVLSIHTGPVARSRSSSLGWRLIEAFASVKTTTMWVSYDRSDLPVLVMESCCQQSVVYRLPAG